MGKSQKLTIIKACVINGHVFIFFLITGFFGIPVAGGDEIVDRIAAVVNDDIITYLEVQKEFKPYEKKIKAMGYNSEKEQKMLYTVRNDIVKKLVEEKLTDQEIERHNITVDEAEIDATIEQTKAKNFWTEEDFRAVLEKESMTVESYRQTLKEQILRTKLINIAVRSNIVITKEDVASYYEQNKEKYQGKLKYHLRNILMRIPDSDYEDEKKAIKRKMDAIRQELVDGKSFETLCAQNSESSLAANGGDLGLIAYENFSPQLKEALESLSPGEYTEVLDTDLGYQIFYIENIVKENEKSLDDVYAEIEEILFKELSEKAFRSWLEELRDGSHIKIIL